jgi:pimeloyl-ACP methyl ester carboxylesterase
MLAALALVAAAAGIGWLWTPDLGLASLDAKYLAAPGDRVDVAGTPLHVRDSGPRDAPAIVLLHGFGASLHTWEPWAEALQGEFRVIRFDLPGSGLSPPDPTGDYSDARSMALLTALLDRLGLAQASLIGNSMGGRIAWAYAARNPQRVSALVLVSPDGFASPGFDYGKAPEVPATLKLMRYSLPRPLLRMSLAPAYANPAALTDALTTRYHDLMRAPGARDAMLARMGQIALVDPVPWLAQIRAPTLLLWGEQDAMIPLRNAADYVKAIPGATLVALPGIGHLPQEEDPARSVQPVQAFLRAHAAGAAPTVRELKTPP